MPILAVSLPGVFIGLAGVMLLAGMAALWQSLRTAFGGGPRQDLDVGGAVDHERAALLEEKKTLLRAIKDIQFEREVGKISEEDFARLDKAYRRRAKEVLRQLDQDLGEFLTKAERLVADAMGDDRGRRRKKRKKRKRGKGRREKRREPLGLTCPSCGADNDLDAIFCKECAARVAPVECASCGTENDPDARFCKSCAASLSDGEGGAASAEAAGEAAAEQTPEEVSGEGTKAGSRDADEEFSGGGSDAKDEEE